MIGSLCPTFPLFLVANPPPLAECEVAQLVCLRRERLHGYPGDVGLHGPLDERMSYTFKLFECIHRKSTISHPVKGIPARAAVIESRDCSGGCNHSPRPVHIDIGQEMLGDRRIRCNIERRRLDGRVQKHEARRAGGRGGPLVAPWEVLGIGVDRCPAFTNTKAPANDMSRHDQEAVSGYIFSI